MKRTFRVRFKIKDGVTIEDVRQYIESAIFNLGGSFPPDDPFFDLQDDDVEVIAPKPRKKK